MEKHRMQYINGEFTNPSGENSIDTVNPSQTDQVVSSFRSASTEEIEKAIASATEALDGWRKKIPQDRVEYLKRLQTLLGENKEKLAYAISLEMGKSIHEARAEVDASTLELSFVYPCLKNRTGSINRKYCGVKTSRGYYLCR